MKLGALAQATRDAVDTNIRLSAEDRTAWVGVATIRCDDCVLDNKGVSIGNLSAIITNTGKTPALQMVIHEPLMVQRHRVDPVPEYDSLGGGRASLSVPSLPPSISPEERAQIERSAEIFRKSIEPRQEVLAPNATRELVFSSSSKGNIGIFVGIPQQPIERENTVVYALAKITYYDIRKDVEHTTNICLMFDANRPVSFCPTGNDMN